MPIARRKETVIAVVTLAAIAVSLVMRFGVKTTGAYHGVAADQWPLIARAGRRRNSAGGRAAAQAGSRGVRLRSARRNFHRHRCPAPRVPGRDARRADALRRRGARGVCRPQRFVGAGRPGQAHARRSPIASWTATSPTSALGRRRRSATRWSSSRMKSARWTASSLEGRGAMDESYLTGEPYLMSKTPGSRRALGGASTATRR